jgi:hypothetical protein
MRLACITAGSPTPISDLLAVIDSALVELVPMIVECTRCGDPMLETMSHCATCGLENPAFAGPFASGIGYGESLLRFSPLLAGALAVVGLFLVDVFGLPDDVALLTLLWFGLITVVGVVVGGIVRMIRRRRAQREQGRWQVK